MLSCVNTLLTGGPQNEKLTCASQNCAAVQESNSYCGVHDAEQHEAEVKSKALNSMSSVHQILYLRCITEFLCVQNWLSKRERQVIKQRLFELQTLDWCCSVFCSLSSPVVPIAWQFWVGPQRSAAEAETRTRRASLWTDAWSVEHKLFDACNAFCN